jgi:probable rRNA maturation factor
MSNILDLQLATTARDLPTAAEFQTWVDVALADQNEIFEVSIRLVDEAESAALNQQYRHKSGATNILSFPFEVPEGIPLNLLGDLVICAPVLTQEARTQGKILAHHWAHIVIHGILHLRGYDHLEDAEAATMEAQEIALLQRLNISNPYSENDLQ